MKNPRKYPFYKEDNSFEKNLIVVTTYNGEKEYRVNCIKYPDGFYVKEKDLIYFEQTGKWTKKSNLIFDSETETYLRKEDADSLIKGVISFDKGLDIYGYFSQNPYTNCQILDKNNRLQNCQDYKKAIESGLFVEDTAQGIYVSRQLLSPEDVKKMSSKRMAVNNRSNVYNVVDDKNLFNNKIKLYNNNNIPVDKDVRKLGKLLGDVSYGIEIETINGFLPEHIQNQYGIIICRDGSLRDGDGRYPPEYVTVPYKGAKGLQSIKDITAEISKRSDISERCSLHIHMGGFTIDRMFMVSLYNLCQKVQNDIFSIFPFYKNDEVRYANKEKNYCQKLPDLFRPFGTGNFNNYIDDSYENLYGFITKKRFDRTNNVASRRNPFGGNKWDIPTRYYWINFTNIFFGKQDTVEFRIHTPTTNGDKIINWLFMCAALVQYAINNPKICLSNKPISFRDDVLSVFADKSKSEFTKKVINNLKDYYDFRKDYFLKDYINNDFMSKNEIKEDITFDFNILK